MVCRDSATQKATPVNPLLIQTPEDEALRRIGEGVCTVPSFVLMISPRVLAHKNRRNTYTLRSLSRVPPSSSEAEALHTLYLQSTVASEGRSHDPQPAGDERVPMGQTRLEKTMMMYPQERK